MNDLMTFNFASDLSTIPAGIASQAATDCDEDLTSFKGGDFRRIKARKGDFLLIDGQEQTAVAGHEMYGVILRSHPYNHCTWYAKQYAPGQEPASPDLCWVQKQDGDFPAALPAEFRQKVSINGQLRWGFQTNHRIIWVRLIIRPDGSGAELDYAHPYAMDLTSMSIFGKGNPTANEYKFSGLANFVRAHSSSTLKLALYMLPMQMIMDNSVAVSSVVCFKPMLQSNGMPRLLPVDIIQKMQDLRNSDEVENLMMIREKLDYNGNGNIAIATPQPAVATPQPVKQVTSTAEILSANPGLLDQAASVMQKASATPPQGDGAVNDLMSRLL